MQLAAYSIARSLALAFVANLARGCAFFARLGQTFAASFIRSLAHIVLCSLICVSTECVAQVALAAALQKSVITPAQVERERASCILYFYTYTNNFNVVIFAAGSCLLFFSSLFIYRSILSVHI